MFTAAQAPIMPGDQWLEAAPMPADIARSVLVALQKSPSTGNEIRRKVLRSGI